MSSEVIELRYGLDSFRSDWRHCSLGSNFLAETAFKTPRAKQLASTAINEVLELAFRLGAKASKSWVQTSVRPGQSMNLSLDVKVKPEQLAELQEHLASFSADPAAYYESHLGQEDPGIFFGMGYLVHDLSAEISPTLRGDTLELRAEINLRAQASGSG